MKNENLKGKLTSSNVYVVSPLEHEQSSFLVFISYFANICLSFEVKIRFGFVIRLALFVVDVALLNSR